MGLVEGQCLKLGDFRRLEFPAANEAELLRIEAVPALLVGVEKRMEDRIQSKEERRRGQEKSRRPAESGNDVSVAEHGNELLCWLHRA